MFGVLSRVAEASLGIRAGNLALWSDDKHVVIIRSLVVEASVASANRIVARTAPMSGFHVDPSDFLPNRKDKSFHL